MRTAATAAALALAVPGGVVARAAPSSPPPTVGCDRIILGTKFPYGGYRLVLGTVSVPPAYLRQVVPTGSRPWAYWRKAGLVVRGGSGRVDVSVPKAWRSRAAITWGNTGIVGSLRIAGCPAPPGRGNAYAGGFYLRSRSACVPLIFRAGGRSATVRFGVGRACA